MTNSPELTYAIISLDSYNRGYDEGVSDLGGIGSMVGNYVIVDQSAIGPLTPEVAASFYAVAYKDSSGNIVISYRSTDNPNPFGPDVRAWTGGAAQGTDHNQRHHLSR
jgi:hypothetical protein